MPNPYITFTALETWVADYILSHIAEKEGSRVERHVGILGWLKEQSNWDQNRKYERFYTSLVVCVSAGSLYTVTLVRLRH